MALVNQPTHPMLNVPDHILKNEGFRPFHVTILNTKDKKADPKLLQPDIAVHVMNTLQQFCVQEVNTSNVRALWVAPIEKFTVSVPTSIASILETQIHVHFFLTSEAGVAYELMLSEPEATSGKAKVRLAGSFNWCQIAYGINEISSIPTRFDQVQPTTPDPQPLTVQWTTNLSTTHAP